MTIAGSDAEFALALCARVAACTDVPGTVTRTYLSPATQKVHEVLRDEMESLGMTVRIDAAGNVRGVYAGEHAEPARFVLGSHIDTVPDAGAYDGVLGVAIAITLIRRLARDRRRLPFALEVIAFSEEEGVRFRLPFIGSRAAVGTLAAEALERRDAVCIRLAQAIEAFGLEAQELLHSKSDALLAEDCFGFLEVHIEQGPVLEAEGLPLGVVSAIVGQSRYELRFEGQANHAGTTPMSLRHDSLVAAAAWVVGVERIAQATAGLVATVGMLEPQPGVDNVIAGTCKASLDVRHAADELRLRAVREMLHLADSEAAARGVRVAARETSCQGSVAMDDRLQEALVEAARSAGVAAQRMHSGAGHDAMILASRLPAAMLFIRSPGGISHHPAETVFAEDVQAAFDTCVRFLDRLDPASFDRFSG